MRFAILGALCALAIAQPASATIVKVTSSGTLSSGFDQTGLFGAPGGDLTGAIYSVVEYYDSDTPGAYHARPSGFGDLIAGGAKLNDGPSPGSAILTVNGVEATLSGSSFAWLDAFPPSSSISTIVDSSIVGGVETYAELVVRFDRPGPLSVLSGWESDCPAVEVCAGSFAFQTNHVPPNGLDVLTRTWGVLAPDSFDVRPAVPEPATWAMMIVGFGLVGSALRRRMAPAA